MRTEHLSKMIKLLIIIHSSAGVSFSDSPHFLMSTCHTTSRPGVMRSSQAGGFINHDAVVIKRQNYEKWSLSRQRASVCGMLLSVRPRDHFHSIKDISHLRF